MPLKCESELAPEELPRMPLFPGKRQRWLLVVRMNAETAADADMVQAIVKGLFQSWLPLFPGRIGEPEVVDASDGPTSSLAQPPALGFREPNTTVAVEFDYMGPATEMRWPTFVARRRERIQAHCPMKPTDSMPIGVEEPEGEAEGDDLLERPPSPADPDPFDLGLGPIDPGKFKFALGGSAVLVGVGIGLVLLVASRKTRF